MLLYVAMTIFSILSSLLVIMLYVLIKNIIFYRSIKNLSTAEKLIKIMETGTGFHFEIRLRAWDGSETGPNDAPVFHLKSKSIVRWMIWSPRFPSLGLVRALVDGNDLDIDGDFNDIYQRLDLIGLGLIECSFPKYIQTGVKSSKMALAVLSIFGWSLLCLPPPIPREEFKPKSKKFTPKSNKETCEFSFNISNKFYELMNGPTMQYSSAYYETPDMSLDEAQLAKLDFACRKLGLKEGMTVLDIGCGWGFFVIHAAQKYGVTAKGITLSSEQWRYAQEKVKQLGLEKVVDVQLMDFRDLNEIDHYDAVASFEMIEHIGVEHHRHFAQIVHRVLKPGGKFHIQMSHRGEIMKKYEKYLTTSPFEHPLCTQYFFPTLEMGYIPDSYKVLEEAGLEVMTTENIRKHMAMTLKDLIKNLEENEEEVLKCVSPGFLKCFKLGIICGSYGYQIGAGTNTQFLCTKVNQEV